MSDQSLKDTKIERNKNGDGKNRFIDLHARILYAIYFVTILGVFVRNFHGGKNMQIFTILNGLLISSSYLIYFIIDINTNKNWILNTLGISPNDQIITKSESNPLILLIYGLFSLIYYIFKWQFDNHHMHAFIAVNILITVYLTSLILTKLMGVFVFLTNLADDAENDVWYQQKTYIFEKIVIINKRNSVIASLCLIFTIIIYIICSIFIDSIISSEYFIFSLFFPLFYFSYVNIERFILNNLLLIKVFLPEIPIRGIDSKKESLYLKELLSGQIFAVKLLFLFIPVMYFGAFYLLMKY
jgi:hypothetical protein